MVGQGRGLPAGDRHEERIDQLGRDPPSAVSNEIGRHLHGEIVLDQDRCAVRLDQQEIGSLANEAAIVNVTQIRDPELRAVPRVERDDDRGVGLPVARPRSRRGIDEGTALAEEIRVV
jgi:hypothetical protein